MDDPNINDASRWTPTLMRPMRWSGVWRHVKPKRKPRSDSGKPRSRASPHRLRRRDYPAGYTVTSGDGMPSNISLSRRTAGAPEIAGYAEVADDHAGALCRVFRAVDNLIGS